MSFEFNPIAIQAIVDSAIEAGIKSTAEAIKGDAKDNCPVDTGNLKGSIDAIVKGSGSKTTAQIGTNVEYCQAVEFGTSQSTVVVPKNAKVLSWIDKSGKRRFAKRVVLPPRAGKPFLTPAYNSWKDRYKLVIAEHIKARIGA